MITLQNIIAPEPRITCAPALYYRATGAVESTAESNSFSLPPGSRIGFDTYFNLFNLGSWTRACRLTGLSLEITASGLAELRIHHLRPGEQRRQIYCRAHRFTPEMPQQVDLATLLAAPAEPGLDMDPERVGLPEQEGLLFLEILSLGQQVTLLGARFACPNLPPSCAAAPLPPPALPRLAISITTYHREDKVRDTVDLLHRFLTRFAFGDQIHVQVVDNGQSAEIRPSSRVSSYPNRNLGGAGGFARGLIEAEDQGFSHCLFMDDDASFHMENILRCYMVLTLARDPSTALAGAMIGNSQTWEMWENGAYFDGSCHPLFNGTDLRCPRAVQQMELCSQAQPATFYGGWWFFAFPIAAVRHHPFPFFVRGDDISFSLANSFRIVTLNGVVSFQEDFIEKESPQTLYLDLRNHLLHHLIFEPLARPALGTAKIACRFMMRSMLRCKYESAAAQLMAWRDVMQGPGFFDRNIDMQARRASIAALITDETWQALPAGAGTERRCFSRLPRRLRHWLGLVSLNGHLLPFWSLLGDRIVLQIKERGLVFPAFGAARLTYLNRSQGQGYRLRHSKARFFGLAWQMSASLLRWLRQHDHLKRAYRQGYDAMTTRAYWEDKLSLAARRAQARSSQDGSAPANTTQPAAVQPLSAQARRAISSALRAGRSPLPDHQNNAPFPPPEPGPSRSIGAARRPRD